jgi:hypothetical protein
MYEASEYCTWPVDYWPSVFLSFEDNNVHTGGYCDTREAFPISGEDALFGERSNQLSHGFLQKAVVDELL